MPASVVTGRATSALPTTQSVPPMKTSGTTGYHGVRYGRASSGRVRRSTMDARDGEREECPDA